MTASRPAGSRATLGKMQNPVRGLLHGSAALMAVIGSVMLVARATSAPGRVAAAVYGVGLVALFATSSLYHSIPWGGQWKKRMQRLDHATIFVLIASTFTPIGVIVLDGWMRVLGLWVAWSIAAMGVGHHILARRQRFHLSIGLMVTMGWLALALMPPLARRVGPAPVVLMAVGGVVYTVGMVIVVSQRPRLWPRVFSSHELFHLLVVAAAAVHFVAIYQHIVPYLVAAPGSL